MGVLNILLLWSEIIHWTAPEYEFLYLDFALEQIILAFKMLVSIAPTLKGSVRSTFGHKLQFGPVKTVGVLIKLTLVIPAVKHDVCPCYMALKCSSIRTVVQIQMNWEAVWNFTYGTHCILFTLCLHQEAEKQKR